MLLSVESSKVELLRSTRKILRGELLVRYSFQEIENSKSFSNLHPVTSFFRAGICKKYCQDGLEAKNEDPLLKKATPLTLWLDLKSINTSGTTSQSLLE